MLCKAHWHQIVPVGIKVCGAVIIILCDSNRSSGSGELKGLHIVHLFHLHKYKNNFITKQCLNSIKWQLHYFNHQIATSMKGILTSRNYSSHVNTYISVSYKTTKVREYHESSKLFLYIPDVPISPKVSPISNVQLCIHMCMHILF
jgi:hypothetical protein